MYPIQPMGDQAVLVFCPDEQSALRLSRSIRAASLDWLVDLVQAYTSLAVFFDLGCTTYQEAAGFVQNQIQTLSPETTIKVSRGPPTPSRKVSRGPPTPSSPGTLHTIPCCYERGLDLDRVSQHTQLPGAEIIELHTRTEYTVHAIGFCPGFPYLGYLPDPLCGVPRLPTPRLRVEPGSVGLTGRQTGIYTELRPGGWNIIGQTPLELVHVVDGYFPLRTGDRIRFTRIDEAEFRRLEGARL